MTDASPQPNLSQHVIAALHFVPDLHAMLLDAYARRPIFPDEEVLYSHSDGPRITLGDVYRLHALLQHATSADQGEA